MFCPAGSLPMIFRRYSPADFPQLYAIEEACFEPPLRFGRAYMRSLLRNRETVAWVAEDDGRLAGFAIIEWSGAPADIVGYIQTIEVSPDFRRRGVGIELLRRLEASAREAGAKQIWLHVDTQNEPAIRLYRSEGYVPKARHAGYYGRSRDAEIYCKELQPGQSAG
ncbi:MAG: N-acetyltransferase family protein [Acidobacteriota bacterium]